MEGRARAWFFSMQHPQDAVELFMFDEAYGETCVLTPQVWFRVLTT
jgi:hypothetical protein